jgi:hypothetical protein
VTVRDLTCNKESEPYSFTITPIAKPTVIVSVAASQSIVNEPITVSFSADQAQHTSTPPMLFVNKNNSYYVEQQIPLVNNSFVYTPTEIGTYKFKIDYRGELGCWSEACSEEVNVVDADIVVPPVITTDVFVNSTTGSDDTGDGNEAFPVKTLAKAAELITEGNSIIFEGDFSTETLTIEKNISLIGQNEPIVGNLVIKNGHTVGVLGNFAVKTDVNVEAGASLQCIGNTITFKNSATNSGLGLIEGEVVVEKELSNIHQLRLFGSPVQQPLAGLPSSQTQHYVESLVTTSLNAGWVNTTDEFSIPGKGYKSYWLSGTSTLFFYGRLNDDTSYEVPFTRTLAFMTGYQGGYCAISNPFLLNLSWKSIYNNNTGKGLNPNVYFFKATSPTAGTFATYNAVTGMSTNGASDVIPIAQGFYIRKNTFGLENLIISKADRTANVSANFRGEVAKQPSIELVRIEAEAENQKNEIVVHTFQKSTKGVDELFDTALPEEDGHLIYMPDAYSQNLIVNAIGDKLEGQFNLTINSKGKTTIKISEMTTQTKVALFDKQANRIIELGVGTEFQFNNFGNSKDRFLLLLGDAVESYVNENQVVIYPNPATEQINISTKTSQGVENLVRSVQIIDLLGRVMLESNKTTLNIKNLASGSYVVKIMTETGEVLSKQFIKE